MSIDVESLVKAYLSIRAERERIREDYEEKDLALKTEQDALSQVLLQVCNDNNASSIKTQSGTVIRRINERFFCNDWGSFYPYIVENNAPELLERRIHQGNFKQFLSEHAQDGLPPGINVMREFDIAVRKSS